ncbi:MAG: type III secretion system effector protein [Simkaniaceae bacterium]|nr:type III secretion system effector protein [Simkaniaceae bacterium]
MDILSNQTLKNSEFFSLFDSDDESSVAMTPPALPSIARSSPFTATQERELFSYLKPEVIAQKFVQNKGVELKGSRREIVADLTKIARTKIGRALLKEIESKLGSKKLSIGRVKDFYGVGLMTPQGDNGKIVYAKECGNYSYYYNIKGLRHRERFTNDQVLFHEFVHFLDHLEGNLNGLLSLAPAREVNTSAAEEKAMFGIGPEGESRFSENAYLSELKRPLREQHRMPPQSKTPLYDDLHTLCTEGKVELLLNYLELPQYREAFQETLVRHCSYQLQLALTLNGYFTSPETLIQVAASVGQKGSIEEMTALFVHPAMESIFLPENTGVLLSALSFNGSADVWGFVLNLPWIDHDIVKRSLQKKICFILECESIETVRAFYELPLFKEVFESAANFSSFSEFAMGNPDPDVLEYFKGIASS